MTTSVSLSLLQDIADYSCTGNDIEVRSYSGRGMYGDECVAIVTHDESGLIEFVKGVIRETQDDSDSPLYEFCENLERVTTDSMGLDTVYYWKNVKATD